MCWYRLNYFGNQVNTILPIGVGSPNTDTEIIPNRYPRIGFTTNWPTYPAKIAAGLLNASRKSFSLELTPTANIKNPNAGA
jgi:hypothetical protein